MTKAQRKQTDNSSTPAISKSISKHKGSTTESKLHTKKKRGGAESPHAQVEFIQDDIQQAECLIMASLMAVNQRKQSTLLTLLTDVMSTKCEKCQGGGHHASFCLYDKWLASLMKSWMPRCLVKSDV